MPVGSLDLDETPPLTSTWRRRGEYIYHVDLYEVPLTRIGRWSARLASMGRLEPARGSQPVTIALTLPDAYGASPDAACATLDTAIDAWMKAQTQTPER